ncbi:hypothetical protein M3G91_28935 [Micromonospora chalcea]|uniref:hypothetical protein n=1 Tax=Micromonospora chalcea TaxID=1874 RepID=UPI0004C2B3B4|nr:MULTISPECIES: hypothetical protein [Micromonospora]MCT2281631.1 hypothetical protein [Micromonospora chalcea]
MNIEDISERLRFEWTAEGGFLYGLRFGEFDEESAERFLELLRVASSGGSDRFDPRVVGRVWMIPYYMLSHITNSRKLGMDVSDKERVLRQANDILAVFFGGQIK